MADDGYEPGRDGHEPSPGATLRAPGPETFARFVAAIDDHALILLDREGHVLSWNAGAERIKGFRADEVIGRSFTLFYPPEAVAVGHPERELEVAALTGRYEEVGWRVRKDGTRFWARVVIIALFDESGELSGFGKVTSDLTSERQGQEQLVNTMRLLEQTVRIDSLTGLPNRRAWDERVAEELADEARHAHGLVVAVVDLDHFKHVNDEHGHAAGDRLLKQAAVRWRRTLRPSDFIARYGGEEFAVALPRCHAQTSAPVLDRLRLATPDEHTCSIGAACLRPGETAADALGRADRAMYEAKAAGRDRVVVVG
jgi:diguanylate cyclase (GGDEF)-like protein/PAS domain S-box-containing protein